MYSWKQRVNGEETIFAANKSFLLRKRMMDVSSNHLLLQIESNNFMLSVIRFYRVGSMKVPINIDYIEWHKHNTISIHRINSICCGCRRKQLFIIEGECTINCLAFQWECSIDQTNATIQTSARAYNCSEGNMFQSWKPFITITSKSHWKVKFVGTDGKYSIYLLYLLPRKKIEVICFLRSPLTA